MITVGTSGKFSTIFAGCRGHDIPFGIVSEYSQKYDPLPDAEIALLAVQP